MDLSKMNPTPTPIVATEAEKLQETVLEIEAGAQLADEREILEEMRQKDEAARDSLAGIRTRVARIKEEQGSSDNSED